VASQIAFVTCGKFPHGTDDDRLAIPHLEALGYTVATPLWNDPDVEWTSFALVVLRSTWDYYYYPNVQQFIGWLKRLDALHVPLRNEVDTVLWNLDKRYLREFEKAGIRIIPYVILEPGQAVNLRALLDAQGWPRAVVKPPISAGAYQTLLTSRDEADAHQAHLESILLDRGALVQPFIPQIQSDGEWSLFYFNREYSHAIIKRPNSGDFRIQGGEVAPTHPTGSILAEAAKVMEQVAGPLLYARVDGIVIDGQLWLMELELAEPGLFLAHDDGAPERFARAIHLEIVAALER